MNSNSILSSSLLDIIFEDRNKEYGAYILRKEYNKRMLASLAGMFVLVGIFIFWQDHFRSEPLVAKKTFTIIDPNILPPPIVEVKKEIIKPSGLRSKPAVFPNSVPVIVTNDLVKPTLAVITALQTNLPGDLPEGPGGDNSIPGNGRDPGNGNDHINPPVAAAPPKEVIDASPGIPAQYPGGMNEFIKFLKRNLRSPRDLEAEESISVRVRFIVSVNGKLLGFNVIQTGGEAFDNEVVRVLRKMPKWVPGKTNGENVSSYYTIPVNFTAEQ